MGLIQILAFGEGTSSLVVAVYSGKPNWKECFLGRWCCQRVEPASWITWTDSPRATTALTPVQSPSPRCQPKGIPKISTPGKPNPAEAPVITGVAPNWWAIIRANWSALPWCPLHKLITNWPFSSMTTTAGSWDLSCNKGAISRSTAPVARQNTKARWLGHSDAIWSLREPV